MIEPGRAVLRVSEGRVLDEIQLSVMNILGETILTLMNLGQQLRPVIILL